MYPNKRRKRNAKSCRPCKESEKSNPSKRHRERLNGELDQLAALLPFEQSVIGKLDKLSILRLAVSFLRIKTHFQVTLATASAQPAQPALAVDMLQALGGFVVVLALDGQVVYVTESIEDFLGFHQSDVLHQNILDLVHSEDREDFRRQLATEAEHGRTAHGRAFTARFRCLLDNTSGFVTMDLTGRFSSLLGQKVDQKEVSFLAVCSPFGSSTPASPMFKSRHRMDLVPVSLDHRGRQLLGYSDLELCRCGAYDLVHPEDVSEYQVMHRQLIKSGSAALLCYRLLDRQFRWHWLQSSFRVCYKNTRPESVLASHRTISDEEARDLLPKRHLRLSSPALFEGDDSEEAPRSRRRVRADPVQPLYYEPCWYYPSWSEPYECFSTSVIRHTHESQWRPPESRALAERAAIAPLQSGNPLLSFSEVTQTLLSEHLVYSQ